MQYTMTTPCDQCPFLDTPGNRRGFTLRRLEEFARGEFPCHRTAEVEEEDEEHLGDFIARGNSLHCAGQLIFNQKRGMPTQMARICERLGLFDPSKLNMKTRVR